MAQARPRVALTAAIPDIPHVISGEVGLLFNDVWSLGFSAGGFSHTFTTTQGPAPVSIAAGALRLRWCPFKGSFFLGAFGGFQKLGGSISKTYTITDSTSGLSLPVPARAELALSNPYLTPHLGWMFITKIGFTFGMEFGVQVPLSSSSTLDIGIDDPSLTGFADVVKALPAYQDAQAQIEDQVSKYGNIVLPYFALRLGWTF